MDRRLEEIPHGWQIKAQIDEGTPVNVKIEPSPNSDKPNALILVLGDQRFPLWGVTVEMPRGQTVWSEGDPADRSGLRYFRLPPPQTLTLQIEMRINGGIGSLIRTRSRHSSLLSGSSSVQNRGTQNDKRTGPSWSGPMRRKGR